MLSRNALLFIFTIPFIIGVILFFIIFDKTRRTRLKFLPYIFLTYTFYCLFYVFELSSIQVEWKIFWDKLQYIPGIWMSNLVLLFSLNYVKYNFGNRKKYLQIYLIYSILLMLTVLFIPPESNISYIDPVMIPFGDIEFLDYKLGFFDYLIASDAYIKIIVSIYLFRKQFQSKNRFIRIQTIMISVSFVIPIVMTIPAVFGLYIFGIRDITPFSSAISHFFLFFAMIKVKIFNIMPIARDSIVENIEHGICVFDDNYKLIDINPKMIEILEIQENLAYYGSSAREIFANWTAPLNILTQYNKSQFKSINSVVLKDQVYYEIKRINLYENIVIKDDLIGFLLEVNDVTKLVQFDELRAAQKLLEEKTKFLESALEEKQTLLREIHHRVKNNLQVISGILTLHDYYTTDEKENQIIGNFQQRLKAMSNIHENIYHSDNLEAIDAKDYFNDIVNNVELVFKDPARKQVKIEIQGESMNLNIGTGLHLGLILNELVSNSYKHAFNTQDSGKITINLSKDGDRIIITYQDNGSGFNKEILSNANDSLGMKIISTSAQQLKAEVAMNSEDGFQFSMKFLPKK